MSPACQLIGALPLADERGAMLLGVACGRTLQGACSLVLNSLGHRLRVDLSQRETQGVVAVLAVAGLPDQHVAAFLDEGGPLLVARNKGQLLLVVSGPSGPVRLLVRGTDLIRSLHNALRRHVTQPAISGSL